MNISDIVNNYININLSRSIPIPIKKPLSFYLKDPSKGVVFKKETGVLVRIFEISENISRDDLKEYESGNSFVLSYLKTRHYKYIDRYVVIKLFNGGYRFIKKARLISPNGTSRSKSTFFGYAEIVQNSVDFILKD